ncbi:MAG TPA: hypothetical protein PKK06_06880 [Phycisphaerae bacterium]|nr:hypothetical protein [Phycisphaerae bacterium]HNU44431.1 hypothetical protein [Phycisphaerae bacterium]
MSISFDQLGTPYITGTPIPIPDVPGKHLVPGVDFGAGDTIYVTIQEHEVQIEIRTGYVR